MSEPMCSIDGLTASEHDHPHPFNDPFEEVIPYLGFEHPKVEIVDDKVVVSWKGCSYEELDAMCLHYRGVSFLESGLTYEELVRSVLVYWKVGIKRELDKIVLGRGIDEQQKVKEENK